MRVTFSSDDLTLEGELTLLSRAPRAAVICHPHPQYGGDMHNPVVRALESGLQQAGLSTLRFNFRGVGCSTGGYAGGSGEQDDARAAVAYLCEQCGAKGVTLAGYSFGAMVGLQAGDRLAAVDCLIAVAPPLAFFDLAGLADCSKPKLFIAGDRDQYCSVVDLARQLAGLAEPKAQCILVVPTTSFAATRRPCGRRWELDRPEPAQGRSAPQSWWPQIERLQAVLSRASSQRGRGEGEGARWCREPSTLVPSPSSSPARNRCAGEASLQGFHHHHATKTEGLRSSKHRRSHSRRT